jgi:DNA-directed RNA polymerase subunit omega
VRDEYLFKASAVIPDPYILVNVVARRVKQLKRGSRPLVESLEKLAAEDIALREIAEGKISYALATPEELARTSVAAPGRPPAVYTSRSVGHKTLVSA